MGLLSRYGLFDLLHQCGGVDAQDLFEPAANDLRGDIAVRRDKHQVTRGPIVGQNDTVTPDKVVCIIEAMKVMNEIKAELEGTVKEVLVKNGQAVEFGEPLFLIEKKK